MPEDFHNIVAVLIEGRDSLLKFLKLLEGQFAVDRCPSKPARMDRRELFDHAINEFGSIDPVGTREPFAKLVDISNIDERIAQDTVFERIDPLRLDGVLKDFLPIQKVWIEFCIQLSSLVLFRSGMGCGDLEFALQKFRCRIGVRRVFKDRLPCLHSLGQIVRPVLGNPLIEQRASLGHASFVLRVQDVKEVVVGCVGDEFSQRLLALVAQSEAFEEAKGFGYTRNRSRLGLDFPTLDR